MLIWIFNVFSCFNYFILVKKKVQKKLKKLNLQKKALGLEKPSISLCRFNFSPYSWK